MTSIRKPWWAAVALSIPLAVFAVGCAEETTTAPPSTPAPGAAPSPSPVAKPEATRSETPKPEAPKAKAETPAPTPTPEATKTETPKTELPPKLEPPKVDVPKPETPKTEPAKKAEATKVDFTPEELAAIKKLPAGEVEAALKQGLCPVSGDHLGMMETPVKITAEGRTFYLCCKGCEKEVKEHPKEVLAKLPK